MTTASGWTTAGYTPYEGWRVTGRFWMTMLRGRVVVNQGKLKQKPGSGQYLHAGSPLPPHPGQP